MGSVSGVAFGECEWCGIWGVRVVWYLGSVSGVAFGECESAQACGAESVVVHATHFQPLTHLLLPDACPTTLTLLASADAPLPFPLLHRPLPPPASPTHSSGVSCCSLSTTPLSVNISWWRPTLCLPRSPPLLPATCLLLQGWFMNGMHVGTPLSGKQNKGAALSWQALPLCPLTLLPGIVQCVLATPHGLFKTT